MTCSYQALPQKNVIDLFLSNILLAIFSLGNFRSTSFLKKHLVFLIFDDNLLALKYCPILFHSSFTVAVVKRVLYRDENRRG